MSGRGRLGALPVFWQTLALLLLSLLITQAVAFAISFVLPPFRPDFSRLSDVAAALTSGTQRMDGEQALIVTHQPLAPTPRRGLVASANLTHRLAQQLNRPEGQVRLFSEVDRGPGFPFGPRRPPPRFRNARARDAVLFGELVAAVQDGTGWRVAASAPRPLISAWQRRALLWFALGALALVPLAWSFARAISRQIGSFAAAADRLGTDPGAPPVEERGAAELRVAARAFNRMQARLAEHLAERTAMIGAIAHDLRTPLARIAFRAEAAPDPTRERILADVSQMQAMISATIGFVRSTGARRERVPVDLAGLVRALAGQERDLERPVTLARVDEAVVAGDPLELERLIQNLIDNGVAYGARVTLSLMREDTTVTLAVRDEGPGLAPDLLERVFQPFARADPSRNRATGGIGLGLTIARTIAADHGGTLHLANRKEGGLEAVLILPAG